MEHLMTSEEVAEYLHVDPVTIRRLVNKGELAAYRIGADYRFAPSDVEAYLQRQRIAARARGEEDIEVPHLTVDELGPSVRNVLEGKPTTPLGELGSSVRKVLQGKRMTPPESFSRFDKFTNRARNVLTLAQEEARRLHHNYIGTEHLLLGLVHEGQGVAAQVLNDLGIELNQVRQAVEAIIGRGDSIVLGEVGITPRAKKVIELA